MSDKILCNVHNIYKGYNKNIVLKGASLYVKQGEIVGLIGENGSGKTTLLKCILGLTGFSKGRVEIISSFGFCPQENILYPKYKVSEHFQLMKSISGYNGSTGSVYLEKLIDKFNLKQHLEKKIFELSSGSYQKVKLITALIGSPELLLLDEPCDGFDWRIYDAYWETINNLKNKTCGILIITHYIYDFKKYNRVYEIKEGKLEIVKKN